MKSLNTLRTPRKQQPLQCQQGDQTRQGESVRQTPLSPLHTVTHTAFRSLDVFVVNKIISTPTLSGTTSVIGVLIKPLKKHSDISIYCLKKLPGRMTLTLIPNFPSSLAAVFVKPITPALLAV